MPLDRSKLEQYRTNPLAQYEAEVKDLREELRRLTRELEKSRRGPGPVARWWDQWVLHVVFPVTLAALAAPLTALLAWAASNLDVARSAAAGGGVVLIVSGFFSLVFAL